MSYNIVQKIRNNYYLYEVTSEWDPKTKRSRQKRKYIGKCDEKGNLSSSESDEVVSKEMGEYYLLFHVCMESGLWKALCDAYGTESAKILFSYSCIRCTRCCPPTQSSYAVRNSTMPDYFGIPLDSRLLTLEGYFNILNSSYNSRNDFFRSLRSGDSVMVFNSDVLCEPIHFYRLYGNKSRFNFNEFPRKSLFSAVDLENKYPFYFRLAKYRGVDRASLNAVNEELRAMGVKEVTFNLRIPSCEEHDIPKYLSSNFNTVLTLSADSPFARKIMEEHFHDVYYDTVLVHGSLYRYVKTSYNFFVTGCDLYIVQDSKAHEDMANSFYNSLDRWEKEISSMKWRYDLEDVLLEMMDNPGMLEMFVLSEGIDGNVHVERNRERIALQDFLFGRQLVVANFPIEPKDFLESYIYSDRLDQDMSIFRTDLQGGATLFPSNEAAVASIMGDYISHFLKLQVMGKLYGSELGNEMNYLDVFSTVSPIKGYWVNGKYGVSKISSEQEKLFKAFGAEIPDRFSRNRKYEV